jgi:D-amino-acid oxidase
MALLGAGLGGCATRHSTHPASGVQPLHSRVELVPVQVSWDRVIRTTIGLRPHRPSGFVLKAEKLDDRTVIHNFGHGGAGMSLSWGTASMAADLALAHDDRRAAVLGCGVVGLTSARELQRRGFTVTIYASTVPLDKTSNMSLAGFTPTSGLVMLANRTPEWEEQFRRAVTLRTVDCSSWSVRGTEFPGSIPTRRPMMSGWCKGGTSCCPTTCRVHRCC